MSLTLFFALLFVVTAAYALYRLVGPSVSAPRTDWYAQGPWQVTSNGQDICIQKGAESPLPVYIGSHIIYDSGLHSRAEKAEKCVNTHVGHDGRKAYMEEIPLIKLRCAQLNQHEYRRAQAQGWAELGEV